MQFEYLEGLYAKNPTKAGAAWERGQQLRDESVRLYDMLEQYKTQIAKKADGEKGDYHNIVNNDDLEAASVTMLNPASMEGRKLRAALGEYSKVVTAMIADPAKRKSVAEMLATKDSPAPGSVTPLPWEQRMFENMPAVAAVTMLTKLQNDIRQAESEALSSLITSVDIGDVRVNELNAYVIPNSNMIIRGGKYSANIVLAAIDTTQRPTIYVNGSRLTNPDGLYEFVPGSIGTHDYSGYIEVARGDGSVDKRPFKSSYTVIEPMATISPTMMNVLYAGINNRFTAVAYVGDTPGEKVEYKNIWCGPDTPKAPENVKLTPSADYTKATLTWDAVTEGEHEGGYVDPSALTYYIFDAFGSYYDPAIAEVKGSTSYTFDYSSTHRPTS